MHHKNSVTIILSVSVPFWLRSARLRAILFCFAGTIHCVSLMCFSKASNEDKLIGGDWGSRQSFQSFIPSMSSARTLYIHEPCTYMNPVHTWTLYIHEPCTYMNPVHTWTLYIHEPCTYMNPVHTWTLYIHEPCTYMNPVHTWTLYIHEPCTYMNPVHTWTLYIHEPCTYMNPVHTWTLYIHEPCTYMNPVHTWGMSSAHHLLDPKARQVVSPCTLTYGTCMERTEGILTCNDSETKSRKAEPDVYLSKSFLLMTHWGVFGNIGVLRNQTHLNLICQARLRRSGNIYVVIYHVRDKHNYHVICPSTFSGQLNLKYCCAFSALWSAAP